MNKDLHTTVLDAMHAWKKTVNEAGTEMPSEEDIRSDIQAATDEFIGAEDDDKAASDSSGEEEGHDDVGEDDNGGDDKQAA